MGNKGKIFWAVVLLLLGGAAKPLFAQLTKDENLSRFDDRVLHFGFYLGVNSMDYRFSHYDNVLQNPVFEQNPDLGPLVEKNNYYNGVQSYRVECYPPKLGFTVGGVINLRVSSSVDLRFTPGMSLGNRIIKFTNNIDQVIQDPLYGKKLYSSTTTYEKYLTTPSAYIDIPLGLRYKGNRFGNVRPYIYGGGAYRRDLENKRISESALHLLRNGYYAEVALGIDTYFPYFRFTGEFKFSYGLNNIIMHDGDITSSNPLPAYGYILKSLNSNVFTLIFFFE
ncbi:MAG: outer membrane beta-barrel protein [Prolixibacteraceae bacterium]